MQNNIATILIFIPQKISFDVATLFKNKKHGDYGAAFSIDGWLSIVWCQLQRAPIQFDCVVH